MAYEPIGPLLAQVRERSGQKQAEIALRIRSEQSRLSRIERGEIVPDANTVESYLKAVNGDLAERMLKLLKVDWRYIDPPLPWHPDADILIGAEESIHALIQLRHQNDFPEVLIPQVETLKDSLLQSASFLSRLDHPVAFIGAVGKGKTTALGMSAGLIAEAKDSAPYKNVALETGGGRTTLCEVIVKKGPEYGLILEPLTRGEVEQLVWDLCDSKLIPAENDSLFHREKGVTIEVENVIRNMSGLNLGKAVLGQERSDPLSDMIKAENEALLTESGEHSRSTVLSNVVSEVARRMRLDDRLECEFFYTKNQKNTGLQWLREQFRLVNRGKQTNAPIPRRITVFVPAGLLEGGQFELSYIDTKGVDENDDRPDIRAQIRDGRTVIVLCTGFNDAPDAATTQVLSRALESGQDVNSRFVLLILAKGDEALQVCEGGDHPETEEEGFALKHYHVKSALDKLQAPNVLPVFFNAARTDVSEIQGAILRAVKALRSGHRDHTETIRGRVHHLIEHQNEQALREAQKVVIQRLERFVERHEPFSKSKARIRQPYDYLLERLNTASVRSVWASTRRSGNWSNFPVYHYLGQGVEIDARMRSREAASGLRELIREMSEDPVTRASGEFLKTLMEKIPDWQTEFLSQSYEIGTSVYEPAMALQSQLWQDLEQRWGRGQGYRQDIAKQFRKWFEEQGSHLSAAVERRVNDAWITFFTKKIRSVCVDVDG